MIGKILKLYLITIIVWFVIYGVLFTTKGLDDSSRQIMYLKVSSQLNVDWDIIKPMMQESPVDKIFIEIERKINRKLK